MTIFKNIRVYDFDNYIENGYVIFDKKIIEVGDMKDYKSSNLPEIDGKGYLLMPGLVNGHSHIYSTFARGMSVPFNPNSFKELLEQLWWKLDRNLTNEATYYSALVSAVEYVKNGVTTIIDHHASGEIIGSLDSLKKGLNEIPLRGVYCFETSDRFNIDECVDENANFIKNNNTPFSKGLFGLHAAFTLSEETLAKVSKNLHNAPIHIHVAESIEDQEYSLKHFNERVINRLDRHNLITKNSILTHGLYLDNEELDIIKKREAVIALNVTSNMNNAVGLPDYLKMKEKGIKVIVGNDGISQAMANEYQNLNFALHHKGNSPLSFSYGDLIEVINNTYSYASDLLGVKLGKIKTGYEADIVVLPYDEPTPINENNVFGHLLFGLFNQFYPEMVFVEGKKVVNNFQVNKTVTSKYNESRKVAQAVWDRMKNEV